MQSCFPPVRMLPAVSPIDRRSALLGLSALVAGAFLSSTSGAAPDPAWTTPLGPFRIAGNLYYVGSRDLASYLIATPSGHILVNSNLTTSPPQIRAAIEKLGFHYHEVKILLISHAHFDHCAGSAQILRETGAKYMVMDADAPVVESGGKADFHFGNRKEMLYPSAKVDRVLHDGEQVSLGGTTLTAHKTAGHTKGCTTWTLAIHEGNQSYNTVIVGSPNVLESYNLIDDPEYPQMAADFAQQFETLQSLPCDIFLGAHGIYFNLLKKYAELKGSSRPGPFLDPAGYRRYVAERKQDFETELARQRSARK